ncbi:MAG: trypsin-like peptidase domain-containing protein [Acidimicrobiia bacterium]
MATMPDASRLGVRRRTAVTLCLLVAVLVPAVPAQAHHRPPAQPAQPAQPAPLPRLNDLLTGLLAALFPPSGGGVAPTVSQRVAASTVRIAGPDCNGVRVGSGFAAGSDLVATAAHVVAGVTGPEVVRPDGRRLPATVVAFDADKDLAVLRVSGLGQSPLPLGRAVNGSQGAVFGHPGGQPQVEISPATIVATGTVRLENLYGDLSSREILRLNARLAPGDSGGAVVDGTGTVVGVAFAVAILRPDVAYAVTAQELQPVLASVSGSAVGTGPCLS